MTTVANPQSWDDVHPGDVITVHPLGHRRSFKMRVRSVDTHDRANHIDYGYVTGQRLTMAGTPSRRRQNRIRVERGERQELIYFSDITLIERTA